MTTPAHFKPHRTTSYAFKSDHFLDVPATQRRIETSVIVAQGQNGPVVANASTGSGELLWQADPALTRARIR